MLIATRPAIQSTPSNARGVPTAVSRWVQLPTAVRRKPAITATVKPNTISCACQYMGEKRLAGWMTPSSASSQSGTISAPKTEARRKNGRKPLAKSEKRPPEDDDCEGAPLIDSACAMTHPRRCSGPS